MNEKDPKLIHSAFAVAKNARGNGNHPFGAVLVNQNGEILLRAENTVVTSRDITAHAEVNLIRQATAKYDREFLKNCTIYTSTEPCPMCAGAIFWSNIRRVVFGLSEENLYKITRKDSEEELLLPCREVFAKGKKVIEVIGPLLEDEAREVHLGFWD